jgi:hypothetical protein
MSTDPSIPKQQQQKNCKQISDTELKLCTINLREAGELRERLVLLKISKVKLNANVPVYLVPSATEKKIRIQRM